MMNLLANGPDYRPVSSVVSVCNLIQLNIYVDINVYIYINELVEELSAKMNATLVERK